MAIQPKWKLFLWRLFHDSIAVKANLARRGIQIDEMCDLCGWNQRAANTCLDSVFWQRNEDGKRSHRCALFIATLWGLWKVRNERCFKGARGTTGLVVELINLAIKEHEVFTEQGNSTNVVEAINENDPIIPPGFNYIHLGKEKVGFDDFIVEVDGSWDKKSTRAGIGWAVKANAKGYDMQEGGRHGATSSALHSEARACLEALKWAKAKGYQGILILSDSISLMDNLQDDLGKDVQITWVLKEIRDIGLTFRRCTILKVRRDQVQRSDDVARKCRLTLSDYM
ncbi:uncharacterized protein LOC110682822 [Chenopodium quinoa]|uniref:uncharacterized protein LOC110682822 n=1 Tax=Chenopodium quinoa TaxID=63459 RepID=UPI000B775B5C|nr:uncharacterized protein LOC110682822 [Chenopodium quinoa]